jgi:hypothetical protein
MFTQEQIRVDLLDDLSTLAWRRHLSPISASSRIPFKTRNGKSWTSNMSTEHKLKTGDGLLNCDAIFLNKHLSLPISISGLFSRKEAKLMTLNGTSWTTLCFHDFKKR